MSYLQIICNDNVFSAVSFQINLWSTPAITPIPSDESFVLESWSQSDALLEIFMLELLFVQKSACSSWLCSTAPFLPQPLHSSDCWSLGGPCCPTITTAQITAEDKGSAEVAAVAPSLCITEYLTTFIISNFFSHQPHFWVTFLFDMFIFVGTQKEKQIRWNRSDGPLFMEKNS